MSERAGRARALPADVTHITSLLPHLDEQTVRRALTLHGNREAAIDALLTSPSAALPRAPPPPKKRAHAGGGGAAKKRPVVAPPPKVVEPPKVAPPPKVDQPPSSDDDAALGSDDGEAYVLEATVAAAPMHAGGLPPPTDAPDADADDASPAAAWVVPDAEMADAEGGAPSALAAAAQAACLALAAAAASSSGGGDSDEAEGVTLYRSHHNITGYVAHISAQFGAIRRNSPTAHPPPIQVQGSRPARPALHRVVQRQVPRHLPDGN
jgi:hypothetical protein